MLNLYMNASAPSFFFYDLETTGTDCRSARIMQFAGQRTDMEFNPIGEPYNVLIKLTPDVVPEPDAIMITGITPQSTMAEGLTEREFLEFFYEEIVKPKTIFLGFNTVRFDDEFMRFLHYRNFYDAYEWQWCDDCSRWDLLDVVRMTRALRPEGIEWPYAPDGRPTNRLEYLTKANGLDHEHAHDALSDVTASIAVAKLIHEKQPRLFDFMLDCRKKDKAMDQVVHGKPFLYISGRYPSENLHATAAVLLAKHPEQGYGYVYDLRHDPAPFIAMSIDQLVEAARNRYNKDSEAVRLPVKSIRYNKCPAVAPVSVMNNPETESRIHLQFTTVMQHYEKIKGQADFAANLAEAMRRIDAERPSQAEMLGNDQEVDSQLYNGFFERSDKQVMRAVRAGRQDDLSDLRSQFKDGRLQSLLPLYKARNFPRHLTPEERSTWDAFCRKRLLDGGQASRLAKYFNRIGELSRRPDLTQNQRYLLEELQLYGESIMPATDEAV